LRKNSRYHFRYILPTLLFVLVCICFAARIIYLQINAPELQTSSELTVRTVAVKAVRGEIYDRNGIKLVANSYSYNVMLDANTFPKSNSEKNQTLSTLIDILGNTPDTQFPVINGYKEAEYKDFDTNSSEYNGFMKMLDKFKLPRNTSCEDLVSFLLKRYELVDKNGKLSVNEEMLMSVMAVRYECERLSFNSLSPVTIEKNISMATLTAVEEASLDGVKISKSVDRVYNYPKYAAHIIGRTGKIQAADLEYYTEKGYPMDAIVGIDGIEKAYEEYLRGIDGTLVIVEDKNKNIVDEYYKKQPVAGNDVYLTIDINMQIVAEDALDYNIKYIKEKADATIKEETEKYTDANGNIIDASKIPQYIGEDVTSGAVTLVNPNTGEIYAMASNPTYNLSTYLQDYSSLLTADNNPLFNRALMGTYEPGSTFKIGVAAAALEYGVINRYTTMYDSGVYKYYPDFQPECWVYKSHGYGHGTVNVISAIQHSCNYFFYETGRLLTIERMNEFCKKLGLGESTGIELPESNGILAGPAYSSSINKQWMPGDTVQSAIGQSDNTFSPLQISMYLSTMINGGNRYRAHLLHSVREFGTNKIIYEEQPETLNTVELSAETVNTIKTGMKSVMENGTAAPVFSDYPIEIGGKTGTAQVGSKKSNNGIFMAFAPYDNPEIVASCIIEQAGGSNDCGLTIRKMFNYHFNIIE